MTSVFPISTPKPAMPRCRILFVVATAKEVSDTRGEVLPIRSLGRTRFDGDIEVNASVCHSNKDGLSSVYNKALEENPGHDIYCFVHDDVEILDNRVIDVLVGAKEDGIDLVGVAGARQFDIPPGGKTRPIGWHNASIPALRSGFVTHSFDGRTFSSSYGDSDKQVLTIDGLFIALMNRGTSLRFDSQFSFDFYDADMSMQAYANGMRTFVKPIHLIHRSPGAGILKPSYMEAQKRFLSKWFDN